MKKLLIIAILFSTTDLYAEETCKEVEEVLESKDVNTPTPENLKGATIIVKQKDGSLKEMSSDEFKVVPRKQQFMVTKIKSSSSCLNQKKSKANRVSLVGGYAPSGSIDQSNNGNLAKIETRFGPNIGLQYQRSFGNYFSIGVQGLSNKSMEVLVGFDF